MTRLLGHVRAVLGRSADAGRYRETDRLAATLAFHWAGPGDPTTPVGRFVATGAISEATVDALYDELSALEQAAERAAPATGGGAWTTQAVVWALLEYAAVHRPRPPVPDWQKLRDERLAARLFPRPPQP